MVKSKNRMVTKPTATATTTALVTALALIIPLMGMFNTTSKVRKNRIIVMILTLASMINSDNWI